MLHFDSADQCVTSLSVELSAFAYATPSHSLTAVFGRFKLIDKGTILSSSRSRHGQRIKDRVFELVEEIALAIRVANQ